jgi:hypothetical protein
MKIAAFEQELRVQRMLPARQQVLIAETVIASEAEQSSLCHLVWIASSLCSSQ